MKLVDFFSIFSFCDYYFEIEKFEVVSCKLHGRQEHIMVQLTRGNTCNDLVTIKYLHNFFKSILMNSINKLLYFSFYLNSSVKKCR